MNDTFFLKSVVVHGLYLQAASSPAAVNGSARHLPAGASASNLSVPEKQIPNGHLPTNYSTASDNFSSKKRKLENEVRFAYSSHCLQQHFLRCAQYHNQGCGSGNF